MRIAILGRGEMGHSFERLLADRCRISWWDKDLQAGEENQPLEQAVADVHAVILAMPAAGVSAIAARLGEALPGNAVAFTIAKGVDADARHPLEILHDTLGPTRIAGLYGPMIGEELRAGKHGFADVAVFGEAAWQVARDVFQATPLRLRRAIDPWGAAWSAVAKNIYVPLLGAAAELGLGDNLRGALFAGVLEEMRRLAEQLGASGEPLTGLSGVGDLFTTVTSSGSHHHAAGRALARGDDSGIGIDGQNIRGEGFHAVRSLSKRIPVPADVFPLFHVALALLESPAEFRNALGNWIGEPIFGSKA